ncbi:hypothetical protein EG240_07915 [Paenimyroides tangerinum]|uniref:Uncharacterized protein n=1 Tax=Paenimyroides tangerinum TaxID=2488728 RepID=A0A3P3W629_9FLAO|nr:hypothetical protein [Paenimyroides tangerinum]RRJ90615.1 hypothetical protein EG240_07915 [Paenimyroides tangerinum]
MYNEIIELDIFDDLIEDKNINIVICTQLIFCDYLNNQHDLNSNYKFEVIKYGFQGYYTVVGIKYLTDSATTIEDTVIEKFNFLMNNLKIYDLITFYIKNEESINNIRINLNR